MSWLGKRLGSSIGLKVVMALTGLGLFGFVVAHLTGNLLIYKGQDAINAYAQGLQDLGGLLWAARAGLLVIFILHIVAAMKLTVKNKAARPVGYAYKNTVQASYASRTMPMTGLLVLCFIIYHLAHFTFNVVGDLGYPLDSQGRHDVYRMVITGFQNPVAVGSYIAAMLILGVHMSHGLWSLFQSLGLRHQGLSPIVKKLAPIIAWTIALANISMPVAVMLGFIKLPVGG